MLDNPPAASTGTDPLTSLETLPNPLFQGERSGPEADPGSSAPSTPLQEPDVVPVEMTREKNPFKRASNSIRTWKALQADIKTCLTQLTTNERDVQEGIYNYRIVVSGVAFKPQKLDDDIWTMHEHIQSELPVLKKKTKRLPIYLRTVKTLQSLDSAWRKLVDEQNCLLDTLEKAPKSVDFYNRIHLARIKRQEQEVRDGEMSRRNAMAKESIEKALSRLAPSDSPAEIATLGSTILRLDDARNYWESRIQELMNLESSASMDAEEVVHAFKSMEDTIAEAPHMAEQVREVEIMFVRLMSLHDELSTFGKSVIPSEDLARTLITVQEEIPRLWATGSWEKLRRTLNEVSNFVKFYDLPVRSELSLAERRKPSVTRGLALGTANVALSQITPLVRSLVSAIDARDRFMRGHSDAVAKTSLQIAKKMNWSGEDLEYLEIAGLLHDVGKIVIPETLLTKTDPLSPDDWKAIQMHPYHGARIVKSIDSLNKIAPWIYHHQERWDGSGYPDRISDKAIPLAARIIAVSEAFTAMTSEQPTHKGLSLDEAMNEIKRGIGSQFDPESAQALIQSIESADIKPDVHQ